MEKLLVRKTDNFNTYNINLENWVCGCPYFLTNRFMICKHLVNLKGLIDVQTFKSIKRNGIYPFLTFDNSLIIELQKQKHVILSAHNGENNNEENINTRMVAFEEIIGVTKRALEILEEQRNLQNIPWINGTERNFNAIKTMVNKIDQYKRRRTMPRTW